MSKFPAGGAVIFVFCVFFVLAAARILGVRISLNMSGSLPHRVFLTVRGEEISCGPQSIGLFRLNVQNPYWDYGTLFAKRFVGCPGDRLSARGGEFCVNGKSVAVASGEDSGGAAVESFSFEGAIPAGNYFVLGDGQRSYDSRYWGFVRKSWIVGRGWPLF